MAIVPVEKIHIIVHKSVKDAFLRDLQKEGIVHITEQEESASKANEELTRINAALNQVSVYKKRNPLSMFFSVKRSMRYETFAQTAESYDYGKTVAELETVKSDTEKSIARLHQVEENITLLSPWVPFKKDIRTLKSFKQTAALPVIIPSNETLEKLSKNIEHIPHSTEHINTFGSILYDIYFVKKDQNAQLRAKLIENDCEIVDFKNHAGTPEKLIRLFEKETEEIKCRIKTLDQKKIELSKEINNLETTSDLLSNENRKKEVAEALPETARTTSIIGWVLKRHIKRLNALVEKHGFAFYEKIDPDPDERPPVALQNSKFSKPYEMLVKLYSMPDSKEYDPTPFLAVFFPIMFGLCLTDAVYGILLIFISLYLWNKVSGDKSLFKILFVGGILTIFAGAMMGGWLGDLFNYIGFAPLIRFKDSLMLFDPVKQPMVFIGLALGLGFIHMMIGIGIEVIDSIKNNEYGQAIFANLTWFFLIPSIGLYFAVFNSSIIAKAILEIVMWFCIVAIIIASHPEGKPHAIGQIVWAFIIWFIWYSVTSTAGKLMQFQYIIQIPRFAYWGLIPLVLFEIMRFKYRIGKGGQVLQ